MPPSVDGGSDIGPCGSRYAWACYAIGANVSMGVGGFLMAEIGHASDDPAVANTSAIFLVWTTIGICGILGISMQACMSDPLPGMKSRANAAVSVAAGVLNTLGMLSLVLALAQDPASAGATTAVLPLGGVIVAVLAFLLLGERLVLAQVVGIGICLAGPVCMALANGTAAEGRALLGALVAAILLGLFAFAKKVARSRGAAPFSVVLIIYLVAGCSGAGGLLTRYFAKGPDHVLVGLAGSLPLLAVASGIAWCSGTMLFQLALVGHAGPAAAILNTNCVVVLVLTVLVLGVIPPMAKVVGMGLCIAGVSILALSSPLPRPVSISTEPLVLAAPTARLPMKASSMVAAAPASGGASLDGRVLARRSAVLEAAAKDPCALDLVVWAAPPLLPDLMERLFDFSWLVDPMVKWAILGPSEVELRRLLQRLQALMMAGPVPNLPGAPAGPNPYLVPVQTTETAIFAHLVGRAAVVLSASLDPPPQALSQACMWNFVDLVDASGPRAAGPMETSASEEELQSAALAGDILDGGLHRKGGIIHLSTPMAPSDRASAWARAGEAVALVRALVDSRDAQQAGVCDGGHLCTTGTCPKCCGPSRAISRL